MKKVLLTLVFGLFFVAFASAQTAEVKKAATEYTVKKDAKTVAYQCPMDCEKGKTYDKAGTCPTCKMDLKAKGSAKAKGCCSGKTKASCGSKAKASSCSGKSKASCGSKAKASSCSGKKKASCGSKKA